MGVLTHYAGGLYGIGKRGKNKRHADGFSTSGHIEEHLGC